MEDLGVSSRDNNEDELARLVTLTERKHELWAKLANCEDEELRTQLFDQLAAYRKELARLREIVRRGLDDPAAVMEPDASATPEPPRSVGEMLRSSLLLPADEVAVTTPPPSSRLEEADPADPPSGRPVAALLSGPEPAGTEEPRNGPRRDATSGLESDAIAPTGSTNQQSYRSSRDGEHIRPGNTRRFPTAVAFVAIAAVALAVVWALFLRPGTSTDTPDAGTATTLGAGDVLVVDQIRAVLDGLGYSSVVIEERSGTIHLGGIVASESDLNAVVGASQALTRDMTLDSSALTIATAVENTSVESNDGSDTGEQQAIVEAPVADGPYIEATLDGKDFVLAGVVPSAELAGEYLRAAEIAYSPYVRSELVVDEQLEPAEWLTHGADAIVLLPMIIDAQIVISGDEVQLSGRAPDQAAVERIQGALGQVLGLPVVAQDVEVANLLPPTYVIAADAGLVELEGQVPSEEIRDMLVSGAVDAYGEANVEDRVTVDPSVYPALWMYSAGPLMQAMSTFPDYELRIDGMAFSGFINGGVTFESNSAKFSGNYAEVLDVGVGVLTRDPSLQLVIEGHTDNLGSDEANLELSQLRAEAVRDYFIANGIDPARLTAIGIGEAEPVVSNDTAEGRARNRRIQYVLSTSS